MLYCACVSTLPESQHTRCRVIMVPTQQFQNVLHVRFVSYKSIYWLQTYLKSLNVEYVEYLMFFFIFWYEMNACLVFAETSEITIVLVWHAILHLLPAGGEKVGSSRKCKCHTSSQPISLRLSIFTPVNERLIGDVSSLRTLPHSEWRLICCLRKV